MKPSDVVPVTRQSSIRTKGEVVAQWLSSYARLFRDAASMPVTITHEDVDAYVAVLEGFDDVAILDKAMARAARMSAYFPKPVQIIMAYEATRDAHNAGTCPRCEGAGYVSSPKGLTQCPQCTPGVGRNGESR